MELPGLLGQLDFSRDFEQVEQLPPPQQALEGLAEDAPSLDRTLLRCGQLIESSLTTLEERTGYSLDSLFESPMYEPWQRTVLRLGLYADYCLRRLLELPDSRTKLMRLLPRFCDTVKSSLPEKGSQEEGDSGSKLPPVFLPRATIRSLLSSVTVAMLAVDFQRQYHHIGLADTDSAIAVIASDALGQLLECATCSRLPSNEKGIERLALRFARTATEYMKDTAHTVMTFRGAMSDGESRGVFSHIHTSELPRLASRDKFAKEKYGDKRVETALEEQLSLVLQSLGFFVTSARRAERTVDIVCRSADPRERAAFLLEAKSSSRAYALPAKDGRAISAYVQSVRRNWDYPAEFKFVLIVGPAAARTLPEKLRQLEAELGIPIRFSTAQDIAALRESLPAAAPVAALVDAVLTSTHVLPNGYWRPVVERFEELAAAHSNSVRTLLGLQANVNEPTSKVESEETC